MLETWEGGRGQSRECGDMVSKESLHRGVRLWAWVHPGSLCWRRYVLAEKISWGLEGTMRGHLG